jgi:hypothetical protein
MFPHVTDDDRRVAAEAMFLSLIDRIEEQARFNRGGPPP